MKTKKSHRLGHRPSEQVLPDGRRVLCHLRKATMTGYVHFVLIEGEGGKDGEVYWGRSDRGYIPTLQYLRNIPTSPDMVETFRQSGGTEFVEVRGAHVVVPGSGMSQCGRKTGPTITEK